METSSSTVNRIPHWTNLMIFPEGGINNIQAVVYPYLEYAPDDFFPSRVHLDVERVVQWSSRDTGSSLLAEGKLEVGMVGRLPIIVLGQLRPHDQYIVSIVDVN